MLSDLQRREAELLAELKNVKALQAAVKPLLSNDATSRPHQAPAQTIAVQQTTGASQPDQYTQLKIIAERRTLADLALLSLREAGRPLPLKQLLQAVRARGGGKDRTVEQLRASLVPTLRRRKEFTSERRGFYGLREWKVEMAS